MPVITLSRQLGSLGGEVSRLVAQATGYRLVERDLINQAALRAGAPEAALAAIDELGLLRICPSPEACLAYRQSVEQVMKELADNGNVIIIGRAGQIILKNRLDTLHVRLVAPFALRAKRISIRKQIPYECAAAQVKASDRYHHRYFNRFYQVDWNDPNLYDLVINTSHLNADEAAVIICLARGYLDKPGSVAPLQEANLE